MPKSSLIKFLLLISVVFNVSFMITAGYLCLKHSHIASDKGRFRKQIDHFYFKELALNEKQAVQIREKRKSLHQVLDSKKTALQAKRQAMFTLLQKEVIDNQAVSQIIDQIAQLVKEIDQTIIQNILKDREILSKEQYQKLTTFIRDHISLRKGMRSPEHK